MKEYRRRHSDEETLDYIHNKNNNSVIFLYIGCVFDVNTMKEGINEPNKYVHYLTSFDDVKEYVGPIDLGFNYRFFL